eukprot:GHVS01029356.1.p1 GENE.GHVS01029356.1~~GHVS01029356.1.p1  ORF type:complete len:310 (-),score=21.43 GHVS01029356.1:793-1599(-)
MDYFDRQAQRVDKLLDGFDDNRVICKSRRLFMAATGRVLEVGAGSGRNFDILRSNRQIKSLVCVEQSENLCSIMRDKLDKLSPPFPVVVLCADVCQLPFEDDSFDSVISSFTLCSIGGDVQQALREVCRVCRRNGRLLLLERGLSSSRIYRWIMRSCNLLPNPRVPWECGYYEDRDPIAILDEANIPIKSVRHRNFGLIYLISGFRPHTVSTAQTGDCAAPSDSPGNASAAAFDGEGIIPVLKGVRSTFGTGRVYYVYRPSGEQQRVA